MNKYIYYKQSGIPWIGDMPKHWELKRGKFVTKLLSGYPFNSDLFSKDDSNMPLIRIRDISSESTESFYSGKFPANYIIRRGDVLVGMDGDFNVAIWKGPDGLLNQRVLKVEDTKKMKARFMYYALPHLLKCINDITYSTTVKHLSTFDIYGAFVPVPRIDEQKAIVDYLDKKCTDIDKAIATQQKRIDLFKEQEQVIIVSAVLNGLTSKVEMLDSKIPYIGKIPAHWTVMPLKYTAQGKGCCFIDGDWIESKDISTDGIKYLTTGNVGPNKYKEQGSGFITEEKFKELDCKDVYPGDLLISRLNEPIARTCIVPELDTRIVTAVDNVIFRPNPKVLTRHFAAYYLNNAKFTEHANIIARGATMHRISRTMLGHLKIALPPVEEQKQIVSYLDKQTAPLESAISNAERKIDLLRSYKQSLITEVVTGKRKVI